MSAFRAVVGLVCLGLGGCAKVSRGNADQVYIDKGLASSDVQRIDAAEKHCAMFGKIAIYRGQYSVGTDVFACVVPSSGVRSVPSTVNSATVADLEILRRSADLGDADAMFKLGVFYSGASNGQDHVAPDLEQSMLWLRRSADHGNSNAMALIGAAYIKGQYGFRADPAEAIRWLRKAANLGNLVAMYSLGMLLNQESSTPTEKSQSMQWFIKSAQLGFTDSMTMAGLGYALGGGGQPPNYLEAMHWLRMAGDKGVVEAMFFVAYFYRYGLGVAINYAEAMRWAQNASQGGNEKAMRLIGEMYEQGLGVSPDKEAAHRWFQMADKKGGA